VSHPLARTFIYQSRVRAGELALLGLVLDLGLVRSAELRPLRPGNRLVARIGPGWWVLLGLRHLWVRAKLRRALPGVRLIVGYTVHVRSVWVL